MKFPDFLATSTAPEKSLLLGVHDWIVYNDSCSKKSSYTLMMTGCNEDEFTCNDATCVSMEVRCDRRNDCQDGTDELDCKVFVTSAGYNKHIVPPTDDGGNLQIKISLSIRAITKISEIDNLFRIKFGLQRTWFDKRLTYYNLKRSSSKNKISLEDRETIWKSWLTFSNVESDKMILRTDEGDRMKVVPLNFSEFYIADNTFLHNTRLSKGSKNAIQDIRPYSVEWLCDFHMEWYPFDTQSCTMQFTNEEDSVSFLQDTVVYTGPRDLSQHYVQEVNMCSKSTSKSDTIIIEIILGRPLFTSFLTTTLPTVMLVIISQMATSFSDEYLDMVIQVNLTVLLVLATL